MNRGGISRDSDVQAWIERHRSRAHRHKKTLNDRDRQQYAALRSTPVEPEETIVSKCWCFTATGGLKHCWAYSGIKDLADYFDGSVDRFEDFTTLGCYRAHSSTVDLAADTCSGWVSFTHSVTADRLIALYQHLTWTPKAKALPRASAVPKAGRRYRKTYDPVLKKYITELS